MRNMRVELEACGEYLSHLGALEEANGELSACVQLILLFLARPVTPHSPANSAYARL